MINENHLLNYDIPEVHQKIDKKEAAFYALSIGLGIDPMDEKQLKYVDFLHPNFQVLPIMAEVICYPGLWLMKPDTGVDGLKLVHGEQKVEWFSPLPSEGNFHAKTRVTNLIDKGEGKGAIIFTEKDIIDKKSGAILVKTSRSTFLRNDGGFGGQNLKAAPKPHMIPQNEPDFILSLPTRPEQALYYRLNADPNPLHANPDFAAKAGFQRPILHGLCTFGVVFHALLSQLANYQLSPKGQVQARFSAPVFPGETIETSIWKDGSFCARVVERDVVVLNNGFIQFG